MAFSCYSNGLLITTGVALLFLPVHYYKPDIVPEVNFDKGSLPPPVEGELSIIAWLDNAVAQFPALDVFATITLLLIGFTFYIFDWIQRKILERRLVKLNKCLAISTERLRVWEVHREELENITKMAQNATSEYNVLLYLILRQNQHLEEHIGPPSETIFGKSFREDLRFLMK